VRLRRLEAGLVHFKLVAGIAGVFGEGFFVEIQSPVPILVRLPVLALGQELVAFAGARRRRNRQAPNQRRQREQDC
jgi:hypothetical protein